MANSAGLAQGRSVQQCVRGRLLRSMAREACPSYRLHRIEVIPWRNRRQYSLGKWQLLRAGEMTLFAVSAVSGVSHFIEADWGVSEPVDRKIVLQLLPSMDLVNHGLQVNRFYGQFVIGTAGLVIGIRVMAHDAELHVLATASM